MVRRNTWRMGGIMSNIEQDTLKYLFTKAKESLLRESEAIKNDLTHVFKEWIKEKIDSGELIVIQIRGEVRTGKSTVGIAIDWDINKYLAKCGLNDLAESYMWKWIFSDQTEFLRFINGEERNVGLCIDEFSSLAKTGVNSTTEEALLDHYSDIFAGQYLHRVNMGTDIIIDKNTTVILDTIGKDEENGITRCKLWYRDVITKKCLVLGHVDVDTSDLIDNWINKGIRKIVETQGIKTYEDKLLVEEWKKKDFYVKYQVKKYKRMELLKKEGVRDIRELEFADIIIDCLNELEELSKIKVVKRELIMVIVDEVIRKHKRIYSIIAKQEIATKVSAILAMNTEINNIHKKLIGTKNTKPTPAEEIIYKKVIAKLKSDLENRTKEIEHLRDLYKQYLEIEG